MPGFDPYAALLGLTGIDVQTDAGASTLPADFTGSAPTRPMPLPMTNDVLSGPEPLPMPIAPIPPAIVPMRASDLPAVADVSSVGAAPSRGGRGIDWLKLAQLVAPVVGGIATRGDGGDGSFLSGYMRGEALARDERDRKARADEEKRRGTVQLTERYLSALQDRLKDVTTPEEFEDELQQAEALAPSLGIDPRVFRQRLRYSPMRADRDRAKEARAVLDRIKKDPLYKDHFYSPEFQRSSHPFRGESVTVAQLRAIAGDVAGADGKPFAPPSAPKMPTFGELWPSSKGSALASQPVPVGKDGMPDIKEASEVARQNGWISTASERAAAHTRYVSHLREQLTDAVRQPGAVSLGALRKRIEAAGLTWEHERRRAAIAVDKENRERARGYQSLERVPGSSLEEPGQAQERRLQDAESRLNDLLSRLDEQAKPAGAAVAPGARGSRGPRGAASPKPPAGTAKGKTVTRAEVRAVAASQRISEAEAARRAKSEGFTIVP